MTHFAVQQVELLWLPKTDEVIQLQEFFNNKSQENKKNFLHSNVIHRLRKYLIDLLSLNIDFKDVRLKADLNFEIAGDEGAHLQKSMKGDDDSTSYFENLCSISCDLRLEKNFRECFKAQKRGQSLINKYCTLPSSKQWIPETWLQVDLKKAFDEQEMRSHDPDLKVVNFSLGNLAGLNTFVEHFSSRLQLPESYKFKIQEVNAKFINDKGLFQLYFVVKKNNASQTKRTVFTHRLFKLELKYDQIRRLLICDSDKFAVYFQFRTPPLLYGVSPNVQKDKDAKEEDEDVNMDRFISFHDITVATFWQRDINLCEGCPAELRLEFAMNTALRLEFKYKDYYSLLQLLKFCNRTETYFTPITIVPARPSQVAGIDSSTFDCFYALKCLLTLSHEFVDQLVVRKELKELVQFFQVANESDTKALTEALYLIYGAIEKGSVLAFYPAIKKAYEKIVQGSADLKTIDEDKSAFIKRAYLFPTHVRFCPPQRTLKNRIINSGTPEFFMRVTVRDIDFQYLNYTVRSFGKGQRAYQEMFFNQYIKRPLLRGIKLGNCHYQYIGASSSQLKSHSLWYFTVDPKKPDVTSKNIRKNIGDLDSILEVPKFMARLGLSFSQALGRIHVPQNCTNVAKPEPDIVGKQKIYMADDQKSPNKKKKYMQGEVINSSCSDESGHQSNANDEESDDDDDEEQEFDPYVFSDGIGRMSQEIADEIYHKLGIEAERPSAVQIRYAGCKGMLVLDPTLEGKKIIFRESMKKYDAADESLEILKYSRPRNVFLNRHFISILEAKGIDKEIFVKLQKEMLHSLLRSMFYDNEASLLLNSYSQLRLNYDEIFAADISFTENPFFRSMMLAIFKKQLELLKSSARIKIPPDVGRNMFGVIDETRSLEYGEVFVQYTKWDSDETEILEGIVLVTKNPCMHPGDVRKFEAVDIPELRHIRDCIVFPAKGHRPHPDEMAGSDLDGDEYVLIWFPDLIFESLNSPPMDFAIRKSKQSKRDRPVEPKDELDHFCNYITNDNSGKLANAYLAWADEKGMFEKDGSINEKCLLLAQLYSKSLDFVKSGVSADMPFNLQKDTYPDFFGKREGKGMYLSKHALGVLFRNLKSLEQGLEGTSANMEYRCDPDLLYGAWRVYEAGARKTLYQYSKIVKGHFKTYGLTSEGELLTGSLPSNDVLYPTTSSKYHVLEMLEFEVHWLFDKLKREFFEEFGGEPRTDDEYTDAMLSKASAWYAVSYPDRASGNEPSLQLFGLPWVVSKVLVLVKLKSKQKITARDKNDYIMIKNSSYVERAIDDSVKKDVPPVDLVKDDESAEQYKFAILDTSHDILMKWVQTLKFNVFDISKAEKCIDDIFNAVSDKLLTCSGEYIRKQFHTEERKKVTSPGFYVLETLLNVADLGTCLDANMSCGDGHQELGLFAWITLVKLACSVNTQCLGLNSEKNRNYRIPLQSFIAEQEDIIETININVHDDDDLMAIYINAPDCLKAFLKRQSKGLEVSFRMEETTKNKQRNKSQNQNTPHNKLHKNYDDKMFAEKDQNGSSSKKRFGKVYSLRITAKGSRFCIERLKEFIFSKQFVKQAKSDEKIKLELQLAEKELEKLYEWGKLNEKKEESSKSSECESEHFSCKKVSP